MQPVLLVVITALLTAVIVAVAMNLYQKNVELINLGKLQFGLIIELIIIRQILI